MKELKAPWSRDTPAPGDYWLTVWDKEMAAWSKPMLVAVYQHDGRLRFAVLVMDEPALNYEVHEDYYLEHPDNEPMAWAPCTPPEVA